MVDKLPSVIIIFYILKSFASLLEVVTLMLLAQLIHC